jgi:hypothetical protein
MSKITSNQLNNTDSDSIKLTINALVDIGAVELKRTIESRGGQQTPVIYFTWRNRFIQVGQNIFDGLWVNISQAEAIDLTTAEWKSIFTHTVPNMSDFTDKERIEWIVAVSQEQNYIVFLMEHVNKLKQLPHLLD